MIGPKLRQWATTSGQLLHRELDELDRHFCRHPWQKFAWQTAKSILVIVALRAAFEALPKRPAELFWIVIYLSPFIFVGVIVGLVLLGRRYGLSAVLSIFAAIAVLSVVQYLLVA